MCLDVEQPHHEAFQPLDRDVRHIAARHDHVADARRPSEVVEHRVPALALLLLELVLQDLDRVVADEVHPGAVPAVLRARGDQLGQHLGGVPVREPFDRPHLGFMQRISRRERVRRELLFAIAEGGRHVETDGIGT